MYNLCCLVKYCQFGFIVPVNGWFKIEQYIISTSVVLFT